MKKRKTLKIEGVKHAEFVDRPPVIPYSRYKTGSSVWAGHKYEQEFAEYMTARFGEENIYVGSWIKYTANSGSGYCQPDLVWLRPRSSIIFECKLSYTPRTAKRQIFKLYMPVLKHITGRDFIGVQVCKFLNRKVGKELIVTDFADIILHDKPDYRVLNWRK